MRADARNEAEQLSELIGAIYDCVLDPGRWDATLDDVRQFLDCANVAFTVVDRRTDTIRVQKLIGFDPHWLARMPEYLADFAELYHLVPDLLTRDIDEPMCPWRDVGGSVILANRYYREWAKPQGLIDSIGMFLMRNPDRHSEIGFGRRESVGVISDREVRLLRLLAPHLRRAVVITDLIDMKGLEVQGLGGVLDTLAVGVLLVAEDGTILHANRAAKDMLDSKTPIASGRGKLLTADPRSTDRLLHAVALAAANESESGAAGIGIALRGQSDEVAAAHVLPLGRGEVRTRLPPRAAAAVFVTSNLQLPFARLDVVAEAFGLTHAETRLLDRLVRGDTIADAAAAMNVATTTVKTHRSRLLSKTGTHRQASLISLVHRLVPPVGAVEARPAGVDDSATFDKTVPR